MTGLGSCSPWGLALAPEVSTSQTCQTCPKAARIGLRPAVQARLRPALENPSLELEGTCTVLQGMTAGAPAYAPALLLCATQLTPW